MANRTTNQKILIMKGNKTMTSRTTNQKTLNPLVAFALSIAFAMSAAASSITVDKVIQRWPWNNKIDITYTVSGGQDVAAGVFARIVFTANIGTTNIVIDGVHDVGASASDGTHTVAWTVPTGLRADGCVETRTLAPLEVIELKE